MKNHKQQFSGYMRARSKARDAFSVKCFSSFKLNYVCFFVAIFDIVHDLEAIFPLCSVKGNSIWKP